MRTEVELRRQVYRRSARKDIGPLDAIEELLAEAVDEAEVRALERLRAVTQAYHRRRAPRP
jgi:hypothetical protein